METASDTVTPSLSGIDYLMHKKLQKFPETKTRSEDLDLEILKYLAEGKTAEEIGAKTFRSFRTIESRIAKLKEVLECNTIGHLVATAFRNKIIE